MSESWVLLLVGIGLGFWVGYLVGCTSLYSNIMDELKRRCVKGSVFEVYSFREALGRWFQQHKVFGGKWE